MAPPLVVAVLDARVRIKDRERAAGFVGDRSAATRRIAAHVSFVRFRLPKLSTAPPLAAFRLRSSGR